MISRLARPLMVALAVLALALLCLWAGSAVSVMLSEPWIQYLGGDRTVLVDAASRWASGESPYPAFQLAGPFDNSGPLTVLYPPTAMLVFLPFAFLPPILWWLVPLGIVVAGVVADRPHPPAIIGIVLLLLGTDTDTRSAILWGNASMFVAAAVTLALRWPAAAPWILLKPTFWPFALFGIRSRRWWLGLAVLGLVSLAFGGLWFEWFASVGNFRASPITYSLGQLPLVLVPIISYLGSRRVRGRRMMCAVNGLWSETAA